MSHIQGHSRILLSPRQLHTYHIKPSKRPMSTITWGEKIERHFPIWLLKFAVSGSFDSHLVMVFLVITSKFWLCFFPVIIGYPWEIFVKSNTQIIFHCNEIIMNIKFNYWSWYIICSITITKHFKILISQFPYFGSKTFLSFFFFFPGLRYFNQLLKCSWAPA